MGTNKKVYRIGVEVTRTEDTLLPEDWEAAFVNVFLRAENIREAIDLAENELLSDKYKPMDTCEAFELDLEASENEVDEKGFPKLDDLKKILKDGGVWYGTFHCFPLDSEN